VIGRRARILERMRRTILAVTNRTGFLDIYGSLKGRIMKSRLVIVMYHRISARADNWSLKPTSPDIFENQIRYFVQNYEIVSLDRVVRCLAEGKLSEDKKALAITVDDGYKDNYACAYPILRKYDVPATIFLVTRHIGSDELFWWEKVAYLVRHATITELKLDELGTYRLGHGPDRSDTTHLICQGLMSVPDQRKNLLIARLQNMCGLEVPKGLGSQTILSWDEVREMSENGIDFGAHSLTHPILTNMPLDKARQEIASSKSEIQSRIEKTVDFFCYPNGVYSTDVVNLVKESGFAGAVTIDPNWISAKTDPHMLGRVPASDDFSTLKAVLCGLWGDLRNVF
jgi:peptidoglycan/xylan/chitin deacetylase (PgdA/CDA1 family)